MKKKKCKHLNNSHTMRKKIAIDIEQTQKFIENGKLILEIPMIDAATNIVFNKLPDDDPCKQLMENKTFRSLLFGLLLNSIDVTEVKIEKDGNDNQE